MSDIEALTERLDKQAAAIKSLRKSRDDLLARLQEIENRLGPQVDAVGPQVEQPTGGETLPAFVPNPLCAMCGDPKGPGRLALTCAACAAVRNMIIKEGGDRQVILRDNCFQCGASFKRATRILCTPCSAAFKAYKTNAAK